MHNVFNDDDSDDDDDDDIDDNDDNDDNDDCVRNFPTLRFHQLRKQSDLVLIRSVQVLIVILMKVILRGRYKMPLYQFRPNRGEMYHKISISVLW